MISFEQELTAGQWVEVLNGRGYIAFDVIKADVVQVYFTETNEAPTGIGNDVHPWPNGWDFECVSSNPGFQWIWVKGSGLIRGVRA